MPGGAKVQKVKRKKMRLKEEIAEEKIVACSFDGNEYTGIVRVDTLGARFLEGTSEKYTWKSGVRYEGPFVASQIDGKGRFFWPDGSTYDGEISNGKRNGEGVYLTADGTTAYEGQWREGKRHGIGKLTYSQGEAFYHGQWENGTKHGRGLQVWPSKNKYEGQWRYGKMSGEGTMTWCDGGMYEQYAGQWEEDKPKGKGIYTWQAPSPLIEKEKEMPSQQMNNCYDGQWDDGVRHGSGSFSYANGARYHGSWVSNVKHGDGRYTFEDGRIYTGPFEHDQMTECIESVPGSSHGRPPNIGAEDNPVRRCIDISDLEPFALPADVGSHNYEVGSGYDDEHDVMREVHNMLLRYLGELKQLYSQYRSVLPRPGADPFVLSMHQLWLLARDLGIVTPSCPLSRLNRFALAGPRHLQEVSHEDAEELRPLTPRLFERSEGPASSPMESIAQSVGEVAASCRSSSAQSAPAASEDSDESAESSGTGHSHEPVDVGAEVVPTEARAGLLDEANIVPRTSLASPVSPSEGGVVVHERVKYPLYSRFWRQEGVEGLTDIHSPSTVMMFRHFLDAIVRFSLARFPFEKGLEHQVRRLFKEHVSPNVGLLVPCANIFSFCVDDALQHVIHEFEPELWHVFKENAAGEGSYGRPQWATIEGDAQSQAEGGEGSADIGKSDTTCDLVNNNSTAGGINLASASELKPGRHRFLRRGFGGQQRRVHVCARLDVTVRIKDILKLFDRAGFLQPPAMNPDAIRAVATLHQALFPLPRDSQPDNAGIEGLQVLLESPGANPKPALDKASDAKDRIPTKNVVGSLQRPVLNKGVAATSFSSSQQRTDTTGGVFPSLPALSTLAHSLTCSFSEHPRSPSAKSTSDPEGVWIGMADAREATPEATTEQPGLIEVEAAPEEILQCNFTMSFLELLGLALEVCIPQSAAQLHWTLTGEEPPHEEQVALLDYVETELTFFEFLRILFRVAERQTEHAEFSGTMQPHMRLRSFFTHVFFPALRDRYTPPTSPEDRTLGQEEPPVPEEPPPPPVPEPEPAKPKEVPKSKKPGSADKTRREPPPPPPEPVAVEEHPPPEEKPQPPAVPTYWLGFDGDLDLAVEMAPRWWLDGYVREIADW